MELCDDSYVVSVCCRPTLENNTSAKLSGIIFELFYSIIPGIRSVNFRSVFTERFRTSVDGLSHHFSRQELDGDGE